MYLPTSPSMPALSAVPSVRLPLFDDDQPADDPKKELQNWSSLIGIITAIIGNILIALALNVQRYAHIRLHQQRAQVRDRARQALKRAQNGHNDGGQGYGTVDANNGFRTRDGDGEEEEDDEDTLRQESEPLTQSFQSGDSRWTDDSGEDKKVASTYLKSPYWWLGQILITIGEMGNFLAYGFAPASIVSPLGVVALISNCVIAPILFKETFRKRDFWGVVIAVAGAVTVVLSANQKETKLEPHDVWKAITTMEFEVYMGVTCSLIVLLMWASPKYGNRTILIDLGLVGLFGGYTALSTKGVSSMLSSTLFGAFTTPVTYMLLFVLLATAVMQVRYVNKALQRFDSTQVIPIQFVIFTLCVIIGSAVLYRDFERTSAEQAAKFVGGCLLTFFGVFLITSGRPPTDEDEETLSDEEGVEETLHLDEQQGTGAPRTPILSPRKEEDGRSRRSSRASRVSFMDTATKPLNVLADTGVPTLRTPAASTSKISLLPGGEAGESAPLLGDTWRDPRTGSLSHPGMGPKALSSDTAVTIATASDVPSEPVTHPSTPTGQILTPDIIAPAEGVVNPRTSISRPQSHHFAGPLFSPSPLSTTVSAVVADTLLKHMDNASTRRLSHRRSRPSLRASLFVPQDELDDEYQEGETSGTHEGEIADTPLAEADDPSSGDGKSGFRRRARSLSNTLSDLFGVKRRRKSANPGPSDEESQNAPAIGGRQPEGSASTDTL